MAQQASVKLYPYRWAILATAFIVHCALQFAIMIVPGLAGTLMTAYGLDPGGFAMISTMPYLTGFLFGILSGAWADNKTIRQVMIIGLIVALVGAAGRIVSTDFILLLVSSFLMGFALAALNANSTKLFRIWFPGKTTGVAMGIYVAGATVGAMAALMGGPFLSVQMAFIIATLGIAASLVLWIFVGKTHPDGEHDEAEESIIKGMGSVVKVKNVWLISIFMFCLFGQTVTQQTFSNVAFTELTGDAAMAGLVSTVNTLAVAIGGLVMPSIVARMKSLRPIMIVVGLLDAFVMFTVLIIPFGPATWILMILQGAFLGILLPMGKTLPALLPDVKLKHLGAAGGLQSTMQNLGAWLIPAYIVTPVVAMVAGGSNEALFVGGGISVLIATLMIILVPETGTSVEAKMQREAAESQKH
jgi:cyanate permease